MKKLLILLLSIGLLAACKKQNIEPETKPCISKDSLQKLFRNKLIN